MPSLALLPSHLCVTGRKLAEKHLGHARQLLSSQEPADIYSALSLLDTALKLSPQWEQALELKARALLCLRRFKDVANLLHDFIPSFKERTLVFDKTVEKEKIKLLAGRSAQDNFRKRSFFQFFSMSNLKKKLCVGLSKRCEREQWRYLVLGQACCHLGMLEDAMILLSNGKRAASAAVRKKSNIMREDSFCADNLLGADSDLVSQLLGNIKFLLRRRTAALAALEAGLYTEAARHFSKILDGRRGTPQGFIAECYIHRATAYQAAGRIADAIADCNRTLALNPICVEALSTRATLYEMVGCFSYCSEDLERLKLLYETVFYNQNGWIRSQNVHHTDFQACIELISNKSAALQQRFNGGSRVDYHAVLGVSRGCSRAEVERAHLLISLKHRPDKAAYFVDRCEFVDERDIESVKDEARSLALRLYRLIQTAYTGIMSMIVDEELQIDKNRVDDLNRQDGETTLSGSCLAGGQNETEPRPTHVSSLGMDVEGQSLAAADGVQFGEDENWLEYALQSGESATVPCTVDIHSENCLCMRGSTAEVITREHAGLDAFPGFNSFDSVQDDVGQLVDAGLFPQASTCRELVGAIISQGLSSEAWMSSNEWSHQAHAPHPLSVT